MGEESVYGGRADEVALSLQEHEARRGSLGVVWREFGVVHVQCRGSSWRWKSLVFAGEAVRVRIRSVDWEE
jgi:hypothetical protein